MKIQSANIRFSWLAALILPLIFVPSAQMEQYGERDIIPETMEFLQDYGYMEKLKFKHDEIPNGSEIEDSLKKMQRFAGLKETGRIDADTILLEKEGRCGVPDIEPSDDANRQKRYVVHSKKWDKSVLTWRIFNYGNDGLKKWKVRKTFQDALAKWANVTNLSFIEIKQGKPDIWFKFVKGNHGDNSPFRQPRSRVIAHAFYPKYGTEGLAGDVHFNDDKVFSIASRKGKNLLWITLHELGHSIGMKHSDVRNSIMYPYYRGYNGKDVHLSQDDIDGIQSLYGIKMKTTQNTKGIVSSKSKPAMRCLSRVTAVFLGIDKKTYIFGKHKLVVLDKKLRKERGPISIWKVFKGVYRVDAAFRRQDGKAVLFTGSSYYVFNEENKYLSGPSSISKTFERMSTIRNIDAAFIWGENDALYLFKGAKYWRYYQAENGMKYNIVEGYPKDLKAHWKGVPDNIDALFTWRDGAVYIFKGQKYYKIDKKLRVKPEFPKFIGNDWIEVNSCSEKSAELLEERSSALMPRIDIFHIFTLVVFATSILFSV